MGRFDKPLDEMNLDELESFLSELQRNELFTPAIKSEGELSNDPYIRIRQRAYRRKLFIANGSLMHAQV